MEGFERPSPHALEQSLLAVAHRNLLGIARGKDHACGIPLFRMGASRGVVAISAVGWADGPRDSQVERALARTTRGEPSQGSPTVWLLGSAFVRRTSWSAGGLRAAQAGREAAPRGYPGPGGPPYQSLLEFAYRLILDLRQHLTNASLRDGMP